MQDKPYIELKLNLIEGNDDYDYPSRGRYNRLKNKIIISIDGDDIESTLFHEYGHYIYRKLMNDQELSDWYDQCTNREMKGIIEANWCSEEFAYGFSDYLKGYDWLLNESQEEFFNKTSIKYIKE